MSTLAVVPARSGSQGFKNKNIATINGKTLIQLAVEVGRKARCIDQVFIDTDSQKYADIAIASGASFNGLRPEYLATSQAKTIDVILYFLNKLKQNCKYLVLLQPTSPVRTCKDVDEAFELLLKTGADAVVSVEAIDEPHPEKIKCINKSGLLESYIPNAMSEIPRQELPQAFKLNGSIYIIKTEALLKHKTFLPVQSVAYIMDKGVNIDSEEDFILLNALLDKGKVSV